MLGWPEHAPYQGIVVTASAPTIPEACLAQLALGGRLVMPVGAQQQLIWVTRESATIFRREDVGWVSCGPLMGTHRESTRQHSRGGQRTSPPPRRGLENVSCGTRPQACCRGRRWEEGMARPHP